MTTKKQRKSSRSLNLRKQEQKGNFQSVIGRQNADDARAIRNGNYNPPKPTNKTKERIFKRRADQY